MYFVYHDCSEFQLVELIFTKKTQMNYTQIVYRNNDAKKGYEFLVEVSDRYSPYHHYRYTHILTQSILYLH